MCLCFDGFHALCHRWWFGDRGNHTRQFKPPYDQPSSNQVLLYDNVQYVYTQPGKTKLFAATFVLTVDAL